MLCYHVAWSANLRTFTVLHIYVVVPATLSDKRTLIAAGHNSRQQPISAPLVGGALPVAHPAYSAPHALPAGGRGTPASMRDVDPPRASASVGRRLSLFCPSEGRFYRYSPEISADKLKSCTMWPFHQYLSDGVMWVYRMLCSVQHEMALKQPVTQ